MKSAYFTLFLCVSLLLQASLASADTKTFTRTVDQPFYGSQSPDDAYMSAVTKAKMEVLELAGTYLESLSVVENAILTKDEVTALAGGIMKTEVITRKNYADEKSFGILLTTRIEVDNSVLRQRLDKLLADRTLLRKYNELQSREQELLARIKALENQNSNLAKGPTGPLPLQQKFAEISVALTAGQWIEKALALWESGQFTDPHKAVEYLQKGIALDDQNPATFNSLAVAFISMQQYREAEDNLKTALSLNPDFCDAYNNLGGLYYRSGNFRQAIAAYTQAIEREPDFVEAILNRGMAYRKTFQFEKAFEDFHRVMAQQPSTSARKEHAGALIELNDIDRLCTKAQAACRMGLCKAFDFLQARDFCLDFSKTHIE